MAMRPPSTHLWFVAWLLPLAAMCPPVLGAPRVTFKGSVLFRPRLGIDLRTVRVSLDKKHVAYVVRRGNASAVIHDGKELTLHNRARISSLMLSPDGARVAYVVETKGKAAVCVAGGIEKEYRSIKALKFSGDGRHVAYVTCPEGPGWIVVIDGKESCRYQGVELPEFSPDGVHSAYIARMWRTRRIVDGRSVFTWTKSSAFVVADGKRQKVYDDVRALRFASDGSVYCYVAEEDGRTVIVDAAGERFLPKGICAERATIGPRGKRVACVVESTKASQAVFVDGILGKEYAKIREITFSPDGKRLAYVGLKGNKEVAVVDGVESKPCKTVTGFVFSPDSMRLAFFAERRDGCVVLDGKEQKPCGTARPSGMIFSPDSKRFVCVAEKRHKRVVVVEGVESQPFDEVLIDTLRFDKADQLSFVGRRGGHYLRMDCSISGK